jgi:uncharacterized protein (DUF952 family)
MSPRDPSTHTRVYKIVDVAQLQVLHEQGEWAGAPIDLTDGFVHLSAADQVMGTLRKHFVGRTKLFVLEVPVAQLADQDLRWEVSRGGDLFPHLFGPLRFASVSASHVVELDASGDFVELALPA